MALPRALENLIAELGKLPGVGRRSAERIAFALLTGSADQCGALAGVLAALHEEVGTCERCGYFTENSVCPHCDSPARDTHLLCVVEQPLDVVAFERAGGYKGMYHVLGGALSPLKGVTPDDLRMGELVRRLEEGEYTEIILATSPSVEGDVTALFISEHIARDDLSITRIGRGVPMGGSLEFADSGTLRMALEGRRKM